MQCKEKACNPENESSKITKRNPQRRQHHKRTRHWQSVPRTRTDTINGSSNASAANTAEAKQATPANQQLQVNTDSKYKKTTSTSTTA